MKTIIWDFNGTILNDMQVCLNIENQMLAERHMSRHVTFDEYRELFCFPVYEYYLRLGYTFAAESYDEVSKEFIRLYKAQAAACSLTDGFVDKIREARRKGYRNVILSVSEQKLLQRQCSDLGISGYFDEILGTDTIHAVSKLDLARRWLQRVDVKPAECLCIGDTTHDQETADALGCRCVLVACGHMSRHRLQEKAEHVVDTMREVQL